jgi:hypothetical protein
LRYSHYGVSAAVIGVPCFGSLKSILNIFRRGVVSLYESQNLNGPFAKLLPCDRTV